MSDNEDNAELIETLRNGYTEATRVIAELRAERKELKAKIEAYEAGRDGSEHVEGQELSVGQLWDRLLEQESGAARLDLLQSMRTSAQRGRACIVQGHTNRIEDLTSRIEEAQRHLGKTLGFTETQPLYSLLVAVRALKNVMVEGLALRELARDAVEEVELPEFVGDRGVREKIDEQLKSAGIDTQSICGFTWKEPGSESYVMAGCNDGWHSCGEVNPLHTQDHACAGCRAVLSHIEAEKLTEAGR